MLKTSAIQVRIDPALKEDAEKIFDGLGLSTSQAVSIFFKQVVLNKGLPFEVKLPDETKDLKKVKPKTK